MSDRLTEGCNLNRRTAKKYSEQLKISMVTVEVKSGSEEMLKGGGGRKEMLNPDNLTYDNRQHERDGSRKPFR